MRSSRQSPMNAVTRLPRQQLHDEHKRLRKELKRSEMEREILKKATVYFAKESQ